MQRVECYRTKQELAAAIDNGGRFYHLFSQAGDNIVTRGELAKAAGTWASDMNAFLFLEIALHTLSASEQSDILNMLTSDLRARYESHKPPCLRPEQLDSDAEAGAAVITEGFLKHTGDTTQFTGFIYTPIVVGDLTTFSMVPIFDYFDVYRLITDPEGEGGGAVVAAPLKSELKDGLQVRVGGYLRELEFEQETARTNKYYLEATVYAPVEPPTA